MVTKKEQIAEALRATQMMLNKHSDKWVNQLSPTCWMLSAVYSLSLILCVFSFRMTDEERENAQEQLKALNQAYNELSRHCSDQTTSAEEVWNLSVFVSNDVLENSATWCSAAWLTFFLPAQCEQLSFASLFISSHTGSLGTENIIFLKFKPRRSKYAVNMLRCARLWSDMSPLLIRRVTLYLQYVMWLTTLFLQDAGYCIPRCMKALNVFSVTLPKQSCTCAHDVLTCP